MHSDSGKLVQMNGIAQRKNSAQLSTWLMDTIQPTRHYGAKARLILLFIPFFPQLFSPARIASLPLFEHYFYPVSTAPTIKTTKEKLKER
jgi:hypothetical protein